MGIGIPQKMQTIQQLSKNQPKFEQNPKRKFDIGLGAWKVSEGQSQFLKWPYTFFPDQNYIFIIAEQENDKKVVDKEKVPIQYAQMFFNAQYLKKYSKIQRKLNLFDCNFTLTIYSYFGDNQQDQLSGRLKLTNLMIDLERCLPIYANCLTLRILNQAQLIEVSSKINEFIDFDGDSYTQIKKQELIMEILFGQKPSFKELAHSITNDKNKIPFVKLKPKKKKEEVVVPANDILDNSNPFDCQITQIKINKKGKGQVDESNLLLKELQMHQQLPNIQQIADKLYLGSEKASRSYSILDSKNIKIVINCAADICKNWYLNDLDYQWIFFPDPYTHPKAQEINIECLVYNVTDVIERYLKNKQKTSIMIHCAGHQTNNPQTGTRSSSLMIGVLMAHFGMGYDEAHKVVSKKWNHNQIHPLIENQLRKLQNRMKLRDEIKQIKLYEICSFSQLSPQHLVAKYLCDIQNVSNIQGIANYSDGVYITVGNNVTKIMVGRDCPYRDIYVQEAKKYIKLLTKFQGAIDKYSIENIDKTFRKQQSIEIKEKILRMDPSKRSKYPGFRTNEPLIFKYPLLRPIWQKKHDDGFYFTIKEKNDGADVLLSKGINWIGYEEDKQSFLDRIIDCYLKHLSFDKIFIEEGQPQSSLLDMSDGDF